MISRVLIGGFVLSIAVAIAPQTVTAQVRGMSSGARGMHGGGEIRGAHHDRLTRGEHRRSFGDFLFYPDFDYYDDDYDRNYETPEVRQNAVRQPAANVEVAATSKPVESLVMENRGGQWVRIPTASEMPVAQASASNSEPGATSSKATPTPPDRLAPAVLVFRDGHEEQVTRYVVQGNVLYTNADYWSTGSWTRKISIAELDVPACVKRSAEQGGMFRLPSKPNEVIVRF